MNEWQGTMKSHARSFHLASLFFPSHLFDQVKALYALCRFIDDAVDEAPDSNEALRRLNQIAYDLKDQNPQIAVNQIYHSNRLDVGYIEDLIAGARSDLNEKIEIKDQKEFIAYCYMVAGSVGLAMFDLMQVKDPKARAHAVDLGIAMQITNICRDVKEDLDRKRIYIPLSLLTQHNIKPEDLYQTGLLHLPTLPLVIQDLLELADRFYLSAQDAFSTIPWRARLAIIIASELYRGIGVKILRKGGHPLNGRVYLGRFEKSILVIKGIGLWSQSFFIKKKLNHDTSLHLGLESWKSLRGFDPK